MNKTFNSKSVKMNLVKEVVKKALVVLFLLLSFTIILVGKPDSFILNKTTDVVVSVFTPIVDIISYPILKTRGVITRVTKLNKIADENTQLREKLISYEYELNQLKYLKKENQDLNKILNRIEYTDLNFVTSNIILDTGSTFSRSLIVKGGEEEGLEKYQPVMSNASLIGQIVFTGTYYSRVLLITDATSKIPVMIERTGTRAFMIGNDTKYPKLIHFENKEPIEVGDKVVTSGLGGYIPKGINIGIVGSISEDNGVIVQPFTDYSNIDYVRIVQNKEIKKVKKFRSKKD